MRTEKTGKRLDLQSADMVNCTSDMEVRSFFYARKRWRIHGFLIEKIMQMKTLEVEVVRVKITLACTECKQRNYNMTKEKKNHPERLETKKYCKFCQRHTMHKETK